jgi:predicted HTH domain antitoxin
MIAQEEVKLMAESFITAELLKQLERLPLEFQKKVLEFAIVLNATMPKGKPGKDLLKFSGTIDPESLKAMEEVVEYGCERVGRSHMKTVELKLNVPEEILYTLNENEHGFIKQMKFYTALELFRNHKLSMGKAAELADMAKVDFMMEAGKHGIALIDYEIEDFTEEVERIMKQ